MLVRMMAMRCQVRFTKNVTERGERKPHINFDTEKSKTAWLQAAGGRGTT